MNAQEVAWAGEHGDTYNRRSPGNEDANFHFFERVLNLGAQKRLGWPQIKPGSIIELGAGQGANLRALHRLLPAAELAGVELNRQAAQVLAATTHATRVYNASIFDWEPDRQWELAFTKGLLIHIHPDEIGMAYEMLHRAAARWILIAEYHNPTPVNVPYQGREDLLWKRDFAGEMLDRYPDLGLVDYGFVYRRDRAPQDDLNWFLLEKVHAARKPAAWPFPS